MCQSRRPVIVVYSEWMTDKPEVILDGKRCSQKRSIKVLGCDQLDVSSDNRTCSASAFLLSTSLLYPACNSFRWLTASPSPRFSSRKTIVERMVIPPSTKNARWML